MPDAEVQLRQYLESTVERIDAEDVLAGTRVTTQAVRWSVRARRPVRTALAAASLVTAAIGVVVLGAWLLGAAGSRIGEAGPTPTAAQPLAPAVWPILLFAGGAVGAAFTTWKLKDRKGGFVDTLERETPEVVHLRKSNRGLIIALVVALLALAGLGIWVLFDKVVDTGIEADINALLDEYTANANASDWEANLDLMTGQFIFVDGDGDRTSTAEYVAYNSDLESAHGDFRVETLGDPVIVAEDSGRKFYVAVPLQMGVGRDPYLKGFSTFVIIEGPDGDLRLISHQWSPPDSYR
ncbi:MAG: hypothetical protein HKN95_11075 [Acidimicrobiia bacterium]|nr:hypothetical protein [Acidimicrobiia bacterium]